MPTMAADTTKDGPLKAQSREQSPRAPSPRSSTEPGQAVHFKSDTDITASQNVATESSRPEVSLGEPGGEVTSEQLRALSQSIQAGSNLQGQRMHIFSFEAFSLPPSRTPSHEPDSREPSRQHTHSSGGEAHHSPLLSPKGAEMQSPPLTPAGTSATEHDSRRLGLPTAGRHAPRPDIITPQDSTQDASQSSSSVPRFPQRPASSEEVPRRPSSSEGKEHHAIAEHRRGIFGAQPGGSSGSLPVSRDASPSRVAASQLYTRPITPAGDANDPYAASRRQPQNKIESRFMFSRKKNAATSPTASSLTLPKAAAAENKRHSGFFSHHHQKDDMFQHDDGSTPTLHSRQSSMSDLKRFFKLGGHNKMKRAASPAASVRSGRSGIKTPPSSKLVTQIPFGDDHGLTSKYGKLGKVLGSGAGGSVRLMKRSEDNTVFAVKEFRPRHSYETEREYVKKLTAEYCIGSSLHHGNIIETLDIVQEKTKWFEVMEYAPYELFAIVMTGRMSRAEVSCCFLQILSGVTYLHSMGLAHRDMKLDNVVVSEHGIMKIIDFGTAHVYKYPFESSIVLASGVVGSDPYLAPEVYDERKYDPTAADIWSMAIIFCCMTLRRFPWKIPRLTDSSYKLFAAEPTPGHDPKKLILPSPKSTTALNNTPARDIVPDSTDDSKDGEKTAGEKTQDTAPAEKREVIRGPWRILRLLPRESRHVIGRMLELNPKERIKMVEILEDPWVANTVICRQTEPGLVINADDHSHVLEAPSPLTK